jgi:excinuclease UvrABC nuclease subunit
MPPWRPHEAADTGRISGWLECLPNQPAVYAVHTANAAPYCGRASQLRRRLTRLLGVRRERSPFLNLRELATRVEVQWTASWLETNLVYYDLARSVHADNYRSVMRLRMPPYVKAGLANPFPRCYVSTRFSGAAGFWYGPFPTRAAAEAFQSGLLDLFQLRRCTEDLLPSPEHPGCIYGEMNLCLRPCQAVVGEAEYASEVARVVGFLSSQGDPCSRPRATSVTG